LTSGQRNSAEKFALGTKDFQSAPTPNGNIDVSRRSDCHSVGKLVLPTAEYPFVQKGSTRKEADCHRPSPVLLRGWRGCQSAVQLGERMGSRAGGGMDVILIIEEG
jgi:hypothetical protein